MTQRRNTDWAGITAVILAVGVFAVIITADIFAGLNHDRNVSSEEVATVSTVLGAAIGAIAGYFGARHTIRPGRDGHDDNGSDREGGSR